MNRSTAWSLFFLKIPPLHTALQGCPVNSSIRIMNKNYDGKALAVWRCHFACSAEMPGVITASHYSQSYWLTIQVLLVAPGDRTRMLMTYSGRLS